ncbi:MAG: hypothetical protein ACR2NZ_02760, partial [Rubripirellula sp.]
TPAQDSTPRQDPFGGDPFDGDPFDARPKQRPEKQPGEFPIQFQVIDHAKVPVEGARVSLLSQGTYRRFPRTLTDQAGNATWSTNDVELQKRAGQHSSLNLVVTPPKGSNMPKVFRTISLKDLKTESPIVVRTRPGIRLSGRVIGLNDKKPVRGISIYLTPQEATDPFKTKFRTNTDEEGKWSIIIPRVDSQVVAAGFKGGYKIGYERAHRKLVDVPADGNELEIPDFELEQIAPIQVVVIGSENEPVPNAHVNCYGERWLNPEFPVLESLASAELTDKEGRCQLVLRDAQWERGRLMTQIELDGATYLGRAEIRAGDDATVYIRLRLPGAIKGTIVNGDVPTHGVGLVLYETVKFEKIGVRSVGRRGETETDERGRFEFSAEMGVTYVVALRQRDAAGVQLTLHKITEPTDLIDYRIPDLDLTELRKADQQRKLQER